MDPAVWAEIEQLGKLNIAALRSKHQELFGECPRSSNKQYLFRRIAWRLQARAEGDLRERARQRAAEIADETEVRLRAPRDFVATLPAPGSAATARLPLRRDWRLPPLGTVLTRPYRGQQILVQVRQDGFEYQGRRYRSLSAIAAR